MSEAADTIQRICAAVCQQQSDRAAEIACPEYPFLPCRRQKRGCSIAKSLHVFMRDGFIDRYSGAQLIFPGVLLALSRLMPKEFPYHRNWKTNECHVAYWELYPTIDHVIPICRGGADDESNWVATSMLRNAAKSNGTLEELGCEPRTAGIDEAMGWSVGDVPCNVARNPPLLENAGIRRWHAAARDAGPQ